MIAKNGVRRSMSVVAVLWILTAPANLTAQSRLPGDVDLNGVRDGRDAERLSDHLLDIEALEPVQLLNADANLDSLVDIADVVFLLTPRAMIASSSPFSGETGVAVTRETIVRFTKPLDANTITASSIFAEFAGEILDARIHVSSDQQTVTLFYEQPLPAAAPVTVILDGDFLETPSGERVDADGDGVLGGVGEITFSTLSLASLPGTSVSGRVFASEFADGPTTSGLNVPLEGVLITADGAEATVRTTTDAMGNFTLDNVPVGRFFVHIDGRTVTQAEIRGEVVAAVFPDGPYYPFVGKAWESVAGVNSNIGDVFLPLVAEGSLVAVSDADPTEIGLPASVLIDHPEFGSAQLTVPAGSLFSDGGVTGGLVGLAPVPPDRLPGPLPEGLTPPLVITVQSDGPANFDVPAAICFPNLPDPDTGEIFAPGEMTALYRFNHDKGDWEIVGAMKVSADGLTVCGDEGVGVEAPGWFFWAPPGDASSGGRGPKRRRRMPMRPIPTPTPTPCPELELGIGDNDFVRAEEFVLNAAGATAACVSLIPGAGEGIRFFVAVTKLTKTVIDRVTKLITAINEGKVDKAVLEAEIVFLKTLKDFFKTLVALADSSSANPIDKYKTLLECVKGFIDTLYPTICPALNSQPPGCWETGKDMCEFTDGVQIGLDFDIRVLDKFSGSFKQAILSSFCDAFDGLIAYVDSQETTQGFPRGVIDPDDEELRALLGDILDSLDTFTGISDEEILGLENSQTEDMLNELTLLAADLYFYERDSSAPNAYLRLIEGEIDPETLEVQEFEQRFRANASGEYRAFLTANRAYSLALLDPVTLRAGITTGVSSPPGQTTEFSSPAIFLPNGIDPSLLSVDFSDTDGDGLHNFGEAIVGTDPDNPDTDGDGTFDGAELQNGTDPLDGIVVATGLIATSAVPGQSRRVDAARGLVAVAASGSAGVSIFNAFNGMDPILISQIKRTSAQDVAVGSRLIAAVANRSLLVIDPARTAREQIIHDVDLGFGEYVVADGDFAYVAGGTGPSQLALVEMSTGLVLDTHGALPGGSIYGLAISGDSLYVLTLTTAPESHTINRMPLGRELSDPSDSLMLTGENGYFLSQNTELFSGDGLIYVAGARFIDPASTVRGDVSRGIEIIEDGSSGLIVRTPSTIPLPAFGVTPAGSGRALFHAREDVGLLDISDPADTGRILGFFATPDSTFQTSVLNGLGYVADGIAGMHTLNYISYDTMKTSPTITLDTNFPILSPEVIEHSPVRLTALVDDDVQVRSVDFFVDGVQMRSDGSFPFEYRFSAPFDEDAMEIVLSARAFDTGGNSTLSAEITLGINALPGATPPTVSIIEPRIDDPFVALLGVIPAELALADANGIAGVEFFADELTLPSLRTSLDGKFDVNAPPVPGTYNLTAEATNFAGMKVRSAPVGIRVADFPTELIRGMIGRAGEVDLYPFVAVPDDFWLVRVVDLNDGLFSPSLTLTDPGNGGFNAGGDPLLDHLFATSRRGVHVLAIEGSVGSGTGPYALYLENLSVPFTPRELNLGSVMSDTISQGGEAAVYLADSISTGTLIVRVLDRSAAGAFEPNIRTFTGTTFPNAGSCGSSDPELAQVRCHLTGGGSPARLVLTDLTGLQTGDFRIFAQQAPDPVGAMELPLGSLSTISTSDTLEMAALSVRATAGDRIFIRAARTDGLGVYNLQVYDPAGAIVVSFQATGSSGFERIIDVASPGALTLLAGDNEAVDTLQMEFLAQSLTNPVGARSIALGETLNGSLALPNDVETFSLEGTEGQRIDLVATDLGANLDFTPRVFLYGPDGSVAQPVSFRTFELDATGRHTIFVRDFSGSGAGDFSLRMSPGTD